MTRSLNRILVVDDDADIQEVVAAALEDFGGYTIEGCTSGAAAVERAPLFRPDLILLDIAMPDMDGLATLQALRATPVVVSTPVVFFTAKTSDPAGLLHLPGIVGVIAKPFHHRHLVAQIGALWESHIQTQQMIPDTERIATIRLRYLQALPQRSEAIASLWALRTYGALSMVGRQMHQIAGSGASLGFAELSATATRVETEIAQVLALGSAPNDIVAGTAIDGIDTVLDLFFQAVLHSSDEPPRWSSDPARADRIGERSIPLLGTPAGSVDE
jgi:CheY-like chemotaxis protein